MAEQTPVRILAQPRRRTDPRARALAPAVPVARGGSRRRGLPRGLLRARREARTASPPAAKLESQLSMYSWGDYDAPEVLDGFTEELGPKFTVDSFGSNEEMIAKLVAAKGTSGYDILVPTGAFIPQMVENELLLKLNKDLIPNIEHVDPAFLGRGWDPDERLLHLQGLGHDRLRLRQDRHHARAQDLERLPRCRAERGERQDQRARMTRPRSPACTSGRTASTGTRPTPPTSTRARTSSSTRSRRTSPRSTRTPARARSRRARRRSSRRGTATRARAS